MINEKRKEFSIRKKLEEEVEGNGAKRTGKNGVKR